MTSNRSLVRRLLPALAVALVPVLGACGGASDDDASSKAVAEDGAGSGSDQQAFGGAAGDVSDEASDEASGTDRAEPGECPTLIAAAEQTGLAWQLAPQLTTADQFASMYLNPDAIIVVDTAALHDAVQVLRSFGQADVDDALDEIEEVARIIDAGVTGNDPAVAAEQLRELTSDPDWLFGQIPVGEALRSVGCFV